MTPGLAGLQAVRNNGGTEIFSSQGMPPLRRGRPLSFVQRLPANLCTWQRTEERLRPSPNGAGAISEGRWLPAPLRLHGLAVSPSDTSLPQTPRSSRQQSARVRSAPAPSSPGRQARTEVRRPRRPGECANEECEGHSGCQRHRHAPTSGASTEAGVYGKAVKS